MEVLPQTDNYTEEVGHNSHGMLYFISHTPYYVIYVFCWPSRLIQIESHAIIKVTALTTYGVWI